MDIHRAFAMLLATLAMMATAAAIEPEENGTKQPTKRYIPVAIKCPEDNNGVFEMITVSPDGNSVRRRLKPSQDGLSTMEISVKVADQKDYRESATIKLDRRQPDSASNPIGTYGVMLDRFEIIANETLPVGCSNSTAKREAYAAELRRNAALRRYSP
jgi:hypothetical protein